jgi:DNA-binding transcriptional LysR family regulator
MRRAAEATGWSQATISRRIQLLERRLGAPLFERNTSGTRLMVAGERFLRTAAVGEEQLRHAANEFVSARDGFLGQLRLGI